MNRIRRLTAGAALVAIVAAGCSNADARPSWTYAPPPPADAVRLAGRRGGRHRAAAAGSRGRHLAIEAFDLGFTPVTVERSGSGHLYGRVRERRRIIHDVTFADGTTL